MGAFSKKRNVLVPNDEDPKAATEFRKKWGWEAHEQVVLQGKFSAGLQEEIGNIATQMDDEGKPFLVAGTARFTMLEQMIVSWTLTDDAGHPMEASLANIRELDADYTTPLLEECDKLAKRGMSKDAQKSFLRTANGPMKVSSTTAK